MDHDADSDEAVAAPPPSTLDADWVQTPDEQPRNSWTYPWPLDEQGSNNEDRRPNSHSEPSAATALHVDIDGLQSEIEQTRAELSETVHALSARLNVRNRVAARTRAAKHRMAQALLLKADEVMSQTITAMVDREGSFRPAVYAATVGVLATVVVLSVKHRLHRH